MVARIGTVTVVLIFAVGAWLAIAPFVIGFQPSGARWTGATRTDELIGGLIALAGFGGLLGVIAGWVGDMYADARSSASLAGTADRGNSTS